MSDPLHPMLRIKHLVFKCLTKTDLDVLEDAVDNAAQSYVAMGKNSEWFAELVGRHLEWEQQGQSDLAEIGIAAVPGRGEGFPAQQLTVRIPAR